LLIASKIGTDSFVLFHQTTERLWRWSIGRHGRAGVTTETRAVCSGSSVKVAMLQKVEIVPRSMEGVLRLPRLVCLASLLPLPLPLHLRLSGLPGRMDRSRKAKQSAGRALLHYPTLRLTTLAYFLAMVQTQHHKTADGASIAYRIHGSGQGIPLVLIMGLSGVMDDWSPLVEELAKSRRGEWSRKARGRGSNQRSTGAQLVMSASLSSLAVLISDHRG
jgi:hypothetical protein